MWIVKITMSSKSPVLKYNLFIKEMKHMFLFQYLITMICKIRITLQAFPESSNLIRANVYIADKLKFYAQNITRGSTLDYSFRV
jgi:hypothetical protein